MRIFKVWVILILFAYIRVGIFKTRYLNKKNQDWLKQQPVFFIAKSILFYAYFQRLGNLNFICIH